MKKAIITGASRGIGRSIALSISDLGYDFFLTGRDLEALEQTKELVLKSFVSSDGIKPKIILHVEDLRRPDAADNIFSAFNDHFERLDLLVNNAGIVNAKALGGYTAADWEDVMNVNARNPFFLMQKSITLLERASPGYIVNICSIAALPAGKAF